MSPSRKKLDVAMVPHSDDAERVVLGAIMAKPEARAEIADWLDASAFYSKAHALIFETVCMLADQGKPCDAVTVADYLQGESMVELVGGWAYVVGIAKQSVGAANIVGHAEIVAEKARLRAAYEIGDKLMASSLERNAESSVVIGSAQQRLSAAQTIDNRGGLQKPRAALSRLMTRMFEVYESKSRMTGLPTPWHGVNEITHGLQPCQSICMAGRPGAGKSVAAMQLAIFTALRSRERRGKQTLVFSLEMSADELLGRAISGLSGIPYDWITAPHGDDETTEAYWAELSSWHTLLSDSPLMIDDTPNLTWPQIVARARRANMQHPVELVVLDYLQLVRLPGKENRNNELGAVAKGGKDLAKELKAAVIELSQLGREHVKTGRRPTMADLRDSGEIEQHADSIFLLHNPSDADPDTYLKGVIELIPAKGRNFASRETIILENRFDVMRMDDWQGPLPVPPEKEKKTKEKKPAGFKAAKAAAETSERKDIDG